MNLKPLLPGHVLVCSRQRHQRLTDLSVTEATDLFQTVQRVQRMLARHYFAESAAAPSSPASPAGPESGSFNIALQDGPGAGQTVAHVHVHVLPRIRGLSAKGLESAGDELYERMAVEDGNVGGALWDTAVRAVLGERPRPGGAFPRIEDCEREPRTLEEMEAEAALFRRVLAEMEEEQQGH